jgi:HAD superfamily hydrolase (TIGR01484 family)
LPGNYKLIALDMDGTLLNDAGAVTEANKRWIGKAAEAGVTVMFSTGRGIRSIMPFAEELSLNSPIVAVNGSEIWSTPTELHLRHTMQPEWIMKMRDIAVETDTWYWAYDTTGVFNRENWSDVGNELDRLWLKFGYYTDNLVKLARIRSELEALGVFEITNSNPCNLELNPKGINKASGLVEVCRLLGIEMEQVIAIGDSLNDIAAIQAAGLGIAMGNAQDEVKQEADDVTDTNEEDGVAKAIQKYIFGG